MIKINFYKKYAAVLFLVVAVLIFNHYAVGDFLQDIFYGAITKPSILLDESLARISKISSGFLKAQRITDENSKLKEENNMLLGELAQAEGLKRENQFLRDQLGVTRKSDAELLIVKLFNIQRGAVSSTVLINKGQKDGILKSMPVIAAGNVLVGIVNEVFDTSSLVLLLNDPRVKIDGRVQDSRILVKTDGRLGDELGLDLVAVGDEVNEGDVVVTSGLDGLPESLLVARVSRVETPSGALFKIVAARPFFDPSLGSNLFVILVRTLF
ncbi:MAG: rod shape-determining protein MreC [Candidatus Yanofskybacteria bacterium RIFCSPHIGHO2_01_FULL_44_17]|uniref:Cell shape-determining protein MreC n=1 Tax=Candidatus Yanofskybacteria bacterium RIFCSPHIGHO2_01_FULL_44_17 TaxID=1802668 RepID=A0A1F8EYS3_9BACT|nr:MAG: rod shape-determining protein MreC [Candidatus Yanofskybacteria bacterium RIFCSPHIGHO2_01_FULL_44_17]